VKSSFLTIISHPGPTHMQQVWASLSESLRRIGPPYLPLLSHLRTNAYAKKWRIIECGKLAVHNPSWNTSGCAPSMFWGLRHSSLPLSPYKSNFEFFSAASPTALYPPLRAPPRAEPATAAPGAAWGWPRAGCYTATLPHQVSGILGGQAVTAIVVLLDCGILPLLAMLITNVSSMLPVGGHKDCWGCCWGLLGPPQPTSIFATSLQC